MPNYRFTGLTPLFYPDERGDDGRSLMALPDDVHDWSRTPDDGQWAMTEDAPEPAVPVDPPADPEPAEEAPELVPAPVDIPADPEPAQAPVAPAEPIPAPEPDPEPELPPAVRDWFAAMGQTPPARA